MFKGTLIAQIIAILGAIFLAKLYGEEAYGIFGVFISITSISSIISTLQLDNCIIISKDKIESVNWFNFLLLLVFVLISFACVVFFFSSFFITYKQEEINMIYFVVPGTLILSYNLLNVNLFTFNKEFTVISSSKIFLAIGTVFLQFILYKKFNLFGLIIGFLISQFLVLFFLFLKNKKNIIKPNFIKIKRDVKANSSIIKFLLPSNIINSFANNLMPILILAVFGAKEAGVYFFSFKILGAPLFLISSSVSQVFFQKASELFKTNKSELHRLTKKIVTTNLLLIFGFLVCINTIGMYVLELYFNNGWENLRLYVFILSMLIFARTSFNPISSLIIVLNKNQISLLFNVYLFAVNLIAIYIGYFYNTIIYTILTLAIFGGTGYLFLLLYFLNYLKKTASYNE
ncbi:oligosaccharide flippase family protein [Polaribacter batillariae]|uniref:Oligosaccharide flippase family protein n=2 Tax=Polaribacter batillariae TaxID=2808900 RepID=A0ABX7SRS4_9FLAO|nr:oligosaccharide flippase family protein [Polaribacter batillariae]